jgi:hypothetical protein
MVGGRSFMVAGHLCCGVAHDRAQPMRPLDLSGEPNSNWVCGFVRRALHLT